MIQFLQEDPNHRILGIGKFYWLGHSLGCKYIALLELLTDLDKTDIQTTVKAVIGEQETQQLLKSLEGINLSQISLKDQASILVAPVIADLEAAIPFAPLRKLINRLGIKVIPSKDETHTLIINSQLFGLIHLIELGKDNYAGETVNWFRQTLLQKIIKDIPLPNLVHSSPVGFFTSPTLISGKIRELLGK